MPADAVVSAGDELLRWISEAGSGSWERLRDACAHVCLKHGVRRRPWSFASDLSALGHIDIDWTARTWSVAPPALNLVPGLGLCLVLTGSRPHHFDLRFDEATDDLEVFNIDIAQPPAPAARLAKCATVETAERVSAQLGASLVVDPAKALVRAMVAVDEQPVEAAPEPALDEAQIFDPMTLAWRTDHDRRPGLYRIDLHGRPVHRRLDDAGWWWATDLPAGQFLALRGSASRVMRWRPAGGDLPACFEIRRELALPVIAERALTVSSGLLPTRVGEWDRYLNVPRSIAESIATALLQDLLVLKGS